MLIIIIIIIMLLSQELPAKLGEVVGNVEGKLEAAQMPRPDVPPPNVPVVPPTNTEDLLRAAQRQQ